MDIICFLNSKDVAEYLESIKYDFTPEQAAYVIHNSKKHNLAQKQAAWQELIEKYSDFHLSKRRSDLPDGITLGEFLKKYIALQNKLIDECKTGSGIYTYTYLSKDDGYWVDGRGYYDSYDKCINAVKEEFDEYELLKIRITKSHFNVKYDGGIQLDITPDGKALDVCANCISDEEQEILNYFDWCWVDIPTPFKSGDVVMLLNEPYNEKSNERDRTFVLTSIVNWDSKKLKENGYSNGKYKCNSVDYVWQDGHKEYLKAEGDGTDMCAYGYGIIDGGQIFYDSFGSYLDLEYYRGEFNDSMGILKALSSFEKGDINAELLVNSCAFMRQKEALKRASCHLEWYTDEGKKLAGLK